MSFAGVAADGPLIFAIGASAVAGLVSFLSPCVLPLVPGYLSYMTGLAGADLDAPAAREDAGTPALAGGGTVAVAVPRTRVHVVGRLVAGSLLFTAGFTVIFTLLNIFAASVGHALLSRERVVDIVVGVLVIVLGAAFLGWIPGLEREWRIQKLPSAGLLGAPVLGAVFAFSWVPCIGPTLGVVLSLSTVSGQTGRAAILAVAYCLGLGIPFMVFGLAYRRLLGVFRFIRRNSRWVTRFGGVLLMTIGVLLITGGWHDFILWLRATVGPGTGAI